MYIRLFEYKRYEIVTIEGPIYIPRWVLLENHKGKKVFLSLIIAWDVLKFLLASLCLL